MQTATNPETGERLVLENGRWVPLKTATNPSTGEQVGLVGGQWVSLKPVVSPPPAPEQGPSRPFQEAMDGVLEAVGSVGGSVAGGLAGLAGGIYDSVTGEDYETARQTQADVANALTYQPRTESGKENIEWIGGLLDNDLFNWLAEAGDTAGQSTNDYLEETPVGFAAPLAGMLASAAPDLAAGLVTGGAGTAAVKGAKALNASRQAAKQRERISPALLDPSGSVGSAQVARARQNVATAEGLPTPVTLTQGQATRNAALMSDEYNLPRQNPGVGAPLARLKEQQQRDLHQNLAQQDQPRANWMDLSSDEELGRKVKATLEARKNAAKEKTDELYRIAREGDAMGIEMSIDLNDAFSQLQKRKFHIHEPGKFNTLMKLADEFGVTGGRQTSISNIEEFRQNINRTLNDITNPNHKEMASIMKGAVDKTLDNAPAAAAAYKRARAAHARNKAEADGNALVTQITGKKGRTESPSVAEDKIYTKIKNAPISDVKKMFRMAAKVPNGVELIHTLGQRVMMDLVEASQKRGGEFNASAFRRELDKLDRAGKLEALYGTKKAQELRDIAEVAETVNTLPYGNTANVSQSGNTVIKSLMNVVGRAPGFIGRGARAIGDADQKKAAQLLDEKRVKQALDIEGLLSYE